VRLAAKQLKKIAKLVELKGVDRSTVLRELIDIGLDSGQVLLLLRRPGTKGRTQVERVIRAVAANERVKVTQSAVMRAPSVETEVNALRAEESSEAPRSISRMAWFFQTPHCAPMAGSAGIHPPATAAYPDLAKQVAGHRDLPPIISSS
jgi:hypothetical protein